MDCYMNWKPIPGWPRYEASTDGQIRIQATGRVLAQRLRVGDEYLVVDLYGEPGPGSNRPNRRIRKTIGVNILVCMAFHGPRPSTRHEAAHCNGKKEDNSSGNLRWATRLENEWDKRCHGTAPQGERNGGAKLLRNQALAILHDTRKPAVIAAEYGIGSRAVSKIKRGDRWAHLQPIKMEAAA
jgi:NUMOD4 motif/HNH endonuclease